MKKTVVGLGEVLWDILPDAIHLGGAPANFAYIAGLMGDRGVVASRVGADPRGEEARRRMEALGLPPTFLQSDQDKDHPTGTAEVHVDSNGQALFVIAQPAAWDFLAWTPQWKNLAKETDAICFGSLAQRSRQSRETIRKFLLAAPRTAVRIFDVNLRGDFYSEELLAESMRLANIVKLNDEELPKIMRLGDLRGGGLPHRDERSSAETLLQLYDLEMVCITRGNRGSLLVGKSGAREHAGFKVKVVDTIGAGDAFTAGLTHAYLNHASLDEMNTVANRVGAWVASQAGATPTPKDGILEHSLAEIG
jgi:fructokinase